MKNQTLTAVITHGRPSEIHDIQRNKARLQNAARRIELLHLGQQTNHRRQDAQQQVKRDEEHVQTASGMRGVEYVAQDGHDERGHEKERRANEQAVVVLFVAVLELLHPLLVPRVHKVNDQNELHEYEHEAAHDAKVHEDHLEGAVLRYVKGTHDQTHERRQLEEPKAVLDVGAWVFGGANVYHDEHEEKVEAGKCEADTVNGKVADYGRAVEQRVVDDEAAANAGQELFQTLAQTGYEHYARDDRAQEQHHGVGETRRSGVFHGGTRFAAEAACGRPAAARHTG